MHPPLGEETLAAMRALCEGERPSLERLAALAGLSPKSLRERLSSPGEEGTGVDQPIAGLPAPSPKTKAGDGE